MLIVTCRQTFFTPERAARESSEKHALVSCREVKAALSGLPLDLLRLRSLLNSTAVLLLEQAFLLNPDSGHPDELTIFLLAHFRSSFVIRESPYYRGSVKHA